jgi:cytochrome P450
MKRMLNFHSTEVRRNPYPEYDQIRRNSPVCRDPQSDHWMVFDYEGVKLTLGDTERFSSINNAILCFIQHSD